MVEKRQEAHSTTALTLVDPIAARERALVVGDLKELAPAERVSYYEGTCRSLGLNPYTRPFDYIEINGKLTLYALRGATDQLREIHNVTVTIISREKLEDIYVVTARAQLANGRTDESIGAVALTKDDGEWKRTENGKPYFQKNGKTIPLRGEELANALMKCETKAKRRVTLSVVGLGWLDESELASVQGARKVQVSHETGEIIEGTATVLEETPPRENTHGQRSAQPKTERNPDDYLRGDAVEALRTRAREVGGLDDYLAKIQGRSIIPKVTGAKLEALIQLRKAQNEATQAGLDEALLDVADPTETEQIWQLARAITEMTEQADPLDASTK